MAASQAPVISNTTPLINLVGVNHLDFLPALYGAVTIASSVGDEYAAGKSPADPDLGTLSWLHVSPDVPIHASLPPPLGAGEAATLSLALTMNARAVLLDEAFGRRIAQARPPSTPPQPQSTEKAKQKEWLSLKNKALWSQSWTIDR